MYKQPSFFEEGRVEIKNNKIIIFCVIIALITIGIIVFTGILTFKMIKGNAQEEDALALEGERTYGKNTQTDPNVSKKPKTSESPKTSEEPSPEPEPSEMPKQDDKFPAHDTDAAMESQSPQYSDAIAKKVVDVYFEETKKVYLTFDDGPSGRTQEILDILDKYDVKATFFVLGANVERNPETTKRIYESGHFIASHGYSHVYSEIYSSPENVLNEYNQSLNAIRNAIGVQSYNPHLFRFPGGSSGGTYNDVKQQAIQILKDNQITYTNWNCLTGDSAGSTTIEQMWTSLDESAAGDDNLVILMHDAGDKNVTVEFLPELIKKYKDAGYEFCSYYDVMTE